MTLLGVSYSMGENNMGWFNWLKKRPKGEKFQERPDITGLPPAEMPRSEKEYVVLVGTEDFNDNILAKTYSKSGKLYCSLDWDMESESPSNRTAKWNQTVFVWIHELMHCALWKNLSITHSNDEKSLLYKITTGENQTPTKQDIEWMTDAANKIPVIKLVVKFNTEKWPNSISSLIQAVALWNQWLGRRFFVLE